MRVRVGVFLAVAALAAALLASPAFAAGKNPATTGNFVSDVVLGNEPNVIPFEAGHKGPQEYAPGYLSGDAYVEPSGAPGPVTCEGNWFGPGLIGGQVGTDLPGNPDAPGMNVDCGSDDGKPHQP